GDLRLGDAGGEDDLLVEAGLLVGADLAPVEPEEDLDVLARLLGAVDEDQVAVDEDGAAVLAQDVGHRSSPPTSTRRRRSRPRSCPPAAQGSSPSPGSGR